MSLELSLYDDDALAAIAAKGVVRRARRDFEAGLATVTERDAKSATVTADGETVRIDARGPKGATCTCPATEICRHKLLAVMALNAAAAPASAEAAPAEDTGPSAADEICALAQGDVQSFAGADWAAAVTLATSSPASEVQTSGRNCTVDIEGSPASVTFLAGLGLKGAAFKGPKTRARVVIAAAALILRAKQGIGLELQEGATDAPAGAVSAEYLEDAAAKLLQSVRMVLAGASPVAADTLFDLAISARAEAAPRLTSEIRALTKQAGQAANRLVHFEPEAFLADAARAYALIQALKHAPNDDALTGVVRRDYQPAPPLDLMMLGAVKWTTETGARGLTLYGYAPATREWRSVVQARGPGMDPFFEPRIAFTNPLWGAASAKALLGRTVHISQPLVSSDGAIAPTLPQSPVPGDAIARTRTLTESGAAISIWGELRADIIARRGQGLHRRATPLPALIAPTRFGALSFDDFTQNYELEALDTFGDAMRLVLHADLHLEARRLSETARPPLLLVETSGDVDRPALRPIALLHDGAQALEVINLTLDQWHRAARSPLDKLTDLIPRKAAASRLAQDPLADLARRALAEATTICAGEPAPNLTHLEQQCDAAGLAALSSALRRMGAERNAQTALAAAYLANETLASLSWS